MTTDQPERAFLASLPPQRTVAPLDRRARHARRGFLARALGVTALLSAASSALGLLRDLLLARYFGANQGTDAFLVAWTVPETAAPLLIEDAMALLMVPAFSLALVLRQECRHGPDPVRQLVKVTLPWLLLSLCILSAAVALGAPQLVQILAPGLADRHLAVLCTRTTAFTVLPFGLAGYLGSALRAQQGFTAPAAIYVVYNLGILGFLYAGHARWGVVSAAAGVAFGSLLMAALLVGPFLGRLRAARRGRKRRRAAEPGLVLIPLAVLPAAAFTLTRQAQVFVERFLGSALPPGTISHLNYAAKVAQFGMTAALLIVTVTFPLIARALAAGDLEAARDRVEKDLGLAAAVVLLGTAFLMACAPAVVALLFERGAFGPSDTAATAAVMRVYSFGLPAQALIGVMVRPYFSVRPVVRRADDPETEAGARLTALDWYPVAAMGIGLLVTIAVGVAAAPHYGALGLAAANAGGITLTAALVLHGLLLRGIPLRLRRVLGGQARLLAAAVGAGTAGALSGGLVTAPLASTLLGGFTVALVFAALGAALGAAEVRGPVLALLQACGARAGLSSAHARSGGTGLATHPVPASSTGATRAVAASPTPRNPSATQGIRAMEVVTARHPVPGLPRQAGTPGAMPWILMYHSIADEDEDPYLLTVSPERFAAQMAWLHRSGRRGVSVRELLRARADGDAARLVGLSFDDGYADFARNAVPTLREYGFTATVFVCPDLLGGDNSWDPEGPRKPLLTTDQVVELSRSGWEIGSHGLGHPPLPGLSGQALAEQTRTSRRVLEELTGRPVAGFCYPYGVVDLPAAQAVRDAGYDYGCAIQHSGLSGRFALPRCYVGERDDAWRLRAKLGRHHWRDAVTGLRNGTLVRPRGSGQ